jgi:RNA polymerase sigma factor (sigma-70 family)
VDGGRRGLNHMLDHLRRTAGEESLRALSDGQLLQRFRARRDADAFAELIHRHGRVVLRACRRQLNGSHDVEDCFQAVWLVLARKAGSIGRPDLLAAWLYGVARRTALAARASAARRRRKEHEAARPEAVPADMRSDLAELLEKELHRLPAVYRAAVLLCDVEGCTYAAAAQRLGLPEGTLAARLSRGRAMLCQRLARQGVIMSAAALAGALAGPADAAMVPAAVVAATVGAAALFASGAAALSREISPQAILLTQEVLRTMHLTKLKIVALAFLLAMLLGGGVTGGLLSRPGPGNFALVGPVAAQEGQQPAGGGPSGGPGAGKARPATALANSTGGEDRFATPINLDLRDVPVTTALDDLRKLSGVNLFVDHLQLKKNGISPVDIPVSLRITGVPARTALRLMLRDTDMGYYVDDGMVVVTTVQESTEKQVRRVYAVADLVGADTKAENLIEVITRITDPSSWQDAGGAGAIVYFAEGRSLAVNHTTAVHEQIGQLLDELRAARPMQKAK